MIKIKEEKPRTRKVKPHYILKFDYMIGDADGDTDSKVKLSADNPFIERFYKLLTKLKPTKGTWGLMLNGEDISKCLAEKQITQDDYFFLMRTMFEGYFDDDESEEMEAVNNYFKTTKENNWANEFYEGVQSDTEYSFLCFQGLTLTYVNEKGEKKKTRITK